MNMIQIRKHVRSQVYKAAFQQFPNSACGFVLGKVAEERIEYALPLVAGFSLNDYRLLAGWLDEAMTAAHRLAQTYGEDIVGIFTAYDGASYLQKNEIKGFLVEYLIGRNLSFLCEFPTAGGETIWGMSVYRAGASPHDALEYKILARRSTSQEHNPRKIWKMWNKLKNELPNQSLHPTLYQRG